MSFAAKTLVVLLSTRVTFTGCIGVNCVANANVSDIMGKVKQKMLMQYYENVVAELDNEEKIDRDICNSIYLAVAIGSWEIDK